ncbi:MAG TPA: saccharopine dehydrogenase NADP-binding domain-containing protein [Gemmatimonadaceae bacterium]|nr:saccharopine dehydrogenase NADP-binding domain-containing protein [Gemmatimonadaceae bacterium]
MAELVVYGSYGYTGRLIVEQALAQGFRPLLSGRDATALRAQAEALGLDWQPALLDEPDALVRLLRDARVVLHCAGPFSRTSRPMADACLTTRTHYVDITGEVEVFESLAARDAEAKMAGIMLLPGGGFDVVPSDCLAAHVARRLPSATHLRLAFRASGGISRGTATTMIENLHRGGLVRRDGRLVRVPTAWKTRLIDFGRGPMLSVTIPWGDVSTAFHSTGVPNVEVYASAPASRIRAMRAVQRVRWLLAQPVVRQALTKLVRRGEPGPSAEQRRRGESLLWAEAIDGSGHRAVARLRGPEGYTMTALTSVAIARRALEGQAPAGFQTPSLAYGSDFILTIPGVVREDLPSI